MNNQNTPTIWRSDVYRIYDVVVAKNIGLNQSIMLRYLYDMHYYFLNKGDLATDREGVFGWFYVTSNQMEDTLGMSRHEQDFAINKLEQIGFVLKKVMGRPPFRYFILNISEITKSVVKFYTFNQTFNTNNKILDNLDIGPNNPSSQCEGVECKQILDNLDIGFPTISSLYIERSNNINTNTAPPQIRPVEKHHTSGEAPPSASLPPNPPLSLSPDPFSIPPKAKKIKEHKPNIDPLWKTCEIVRLSQERYDRLVTTFGQQQVDSTITAMDGWCLMHGKTYKRYDAAIGNWIRNNDKNNSVLASGASVASNPGSAVQNKIYKGPADAINASIAKSPHDIPLEQRPNREVYKINSQLYALYKQKGKDMRGFEDDPSLNAKPFTGKVHNYTPPT